MKRTFLTISLATLCTQNSFSMDTYNTTEPLLAKFRTNEKTASLDEIVNTIDNAINAKVSRILSIFDVGKIPKEKMFDIINTIAEWYPEVTPRSQLIKALYSKNKYFAQAINYYISLARENIKNISCVNLKEMENYTDQQPTDALNKLPQAIRKFVMRKAGRLTESSYKMVFSEHAGNIKSFHVCPAVNLAATSCNDKNLYLWNLATSKCMYTFPESVTDYIRFSPTGSQLAVVIEEDHKQYVNIWDTQSKKLLATISKEQIGKTIEGTVNTVDIASIEYLYNLQKSSDNTLSIFIHGNGFNKRIQLLYSLNKFPIKNPKVLQLPYTIQSYCPHTDTTIYSAYIPKLSPKTLIVTKKYSPELDRLVQAIHNTQNPQSFSKIEPSKSYRKLTSLEKLMIAGEMSKQRQITNKLLTNK